MNNQEKQDFVKKEVILPDGRYLIYYDFDEHQKSSDEHATENQAKGEN